MKRTSLGVLLALLVLCCGVITVILLSGRTKEKEADFMEFCAIGYSDVVSFIVQGYKCHWEEFSPADMGLSAVYCYESLYAGSCSADINGDGVPELLLGDQFEDGSFLLYDIYTFDKKNLETIHLLSGGERDYFVLNGDGIIIEHGSSSAFDSFDKYYRLEGTALTELSDEALEETLYHLEMDPFMRYVAPASYVVLRDGETLGQLSRIYDDSYLVDAQDTVSVPKEGAVVEYWSAWDGKGVVYLTEPGKAPVYEYADTASTVLGEAVYELGYCPETYECRGYIPGWLRISFAGREGYISEETSSWDYADRF